MRTKGNGLTGMVYPTTSRAPAPQSFQPPPLGRRRQTHLDLPPRVQMKGRRYYYVCRGKWTPLGADPVRMRVLWAELYNDVPQGVSVADLVARYIEREERPASTLQQYRSYQREIAEAFPISANKLTSTHVAVWRESRAQRERKHYTNGCIAVLVSAFKYGHELGLSGLLTVSKYAVQGRDKYVEDWEFQAVYRRAPTWLQIAMDLAYLTAPRPSDLLALRWDDIRDGRLYFRTRKTKQRQAFDITPELQAVLDRARRRPIVGLYIIASDKGRPINRGTFSNAWLAARGELRDFQFRDIRAKSATDADEDGQDAQAMLGHTTARTTQHYIRKRKTIVAQPVKRRMGK